MKHTLTSIIAGGVLMGACLDAYQDRHRLQQIERLAVCEEVFRAQADIVDCVAVQQLVDLVREREARR